MTDPRHRLGLAAEEAVARWLTAAGWTIVGRRVRSDEGGETDLIALDRDRALVAVEVRARRTERVGRAVETIDRQRLTRLGRTLAAVAGGRRLRHTGLRIDLVTVEPASTGPGTWRLRRIPAVGDS
jgi:putative endonuclease